MLSNYGRRLTFKPAQTPFVFKFHVFLFQNQLTIKCNDYHILYLIIITYNRVLSEILNIFGSISCTPISSFQPLLLHFPCDFPSLQILSQSSSYKSFLSHFACIVNITFFLIVCIFNGISNTTSQNRK